jgi:diguanylate cyclase (GGDEF)-like protein
MTARFAALPLSLRGLIGVFVLVQIGWIALLAYHTWQRQQDELQSDLLADARFLAIAGKATFDSVGYGLVALADRLDSELGDPLRAPQAATKELRFSQRLYSSVADITLAAPDGRLLAHSLYPDPATIPQPAERADFAIRLGQYRSPPNGYSIGTTEGRAASDQWRMVIRQTHYRSDGQPHFILSADIPIDAEHPLWSNLSLPEKYALTIARLDGTIVARWPAPNPAKIYGTGAEAPLMRFLAENMQRSSEGVMHIPVSVDGRERLAIFSQFDNLPLVAIASVDYSLLRDQWLSRNQAWFFSGALFLFLTVGMFFYLTLLERRHHGELEEASHTDALTGLLNRRGIFVRAHDILGGQPRTLSLFYLDLDSFKAINDDYGHDCGDEMLCQCAQRIRAAIRANDLAARLGGDEFVVLLPDTEPAAAQAILARVREQFNEPFLIKGRRLHMRPSIGTACLSEAGQSLEELLTSADLSMYAEKSSHKHQPAAAADIASAAEALPEA